jgi:S1-C subfamily serine protease
VTPAGPQLSPERRASLLERADRALGNQPVATAVAKVRAIIGVPQVPDSETAAQAALDKLKGGREEPTPAELAALELVVRMMRPAPLSKHGELDPLPSAPGSSTYNPELVKKWDAFREAVRPYIYSIGRLDLANGPDAAQGSGFLVAPGLLVTNRHVLGHLSGGTELLEEGQAVVRFNQEYGTPDPTPAAFPIVAVAAVHDTLDMALLRVRLADERAHPVLDASPNPTGPVAAIGYPWKDPTSPLFADAIYGGTYGVKRAAIGEVITAGPKSLFHDCSTLGGNSGSPVFSLESGKVIGLHVSGFFMWRNEAVPAAELEAFVATAPAA